MSRPARGIAAGWRALEVLVAVVRAAGGGLVFDGGHMLTTSTRAAGGAVGDVLYGPLPGGRVRLSLA